MLKKLWSLLEHSSGQISWDRVPVQSLLRLQLKQSREEGEQCTVLSSLFTRALFITVYHCSIRSGLFVGKMNGSDHVQSLSCSGFSESASVGPWQPSEKRTCAVLRGTRCASSRSSAFRPPPPHGGRPLCLFRHCRSRHVQLYTRDDLNIIQGAKRMHARK